MRLNINSAAMLVDACCVAHFMCSDIVMLRRVSIAQEHEDLSATLTFSEAAIYTCIVSLSLEE